MKRNVDHARPVEKDAPTSANQIGARLEDIGLLREITHHRNRCFRCEPYLRLFEEGKGRYEQDGGEIVRCQWQSEPVTLDAAVAASMKELGYGG